MSELATVQRIGPALPVMRRVCNSCYGTGSHDVCFDFGSNLALCEPCTRCGGTGVVEYEVQLQEAT